MQEAITGYLQHPAPDSPYLQDMEFLTRRGRSASSQRDLHGRGTRMATLLGAFVADHLGCMADIFGARTARTYGHLTLQRGAVEAAARVRYLLALPSSPASRLVHFAAFLVADSTEDLKATADIEAQWDQFPRERALELRERSAATQALVQACGMQLERAGKRVVRIRWAEHDAQAQTFPNMTELVRTTMPQHPGAYRFGSGAAHAQPWVLHTAHRPLAAGPLSHEPTPTAVAASVDLAITASTLTVATFADWLGHDPARELTSAQSRQEIVARIAKQMVGRG